MLERYCIPAISDRLVSAWMPMTYRQDATRLTPAARQHIPARLSVYKLHILPTESIRMHIVLGALGVIVTILILVNRLSDSGIDIGWLNPFAWKRRRDWAKKYHANPIYALTSPMEVTALLMVALAKSEGEISSEQKREIKRKFQEVFHLNDDRAAGLLASSSFLLKAGIDDVRHVGRLLEPSIDRFSEDQAASALELIRHIANFEGPTNAFQNEIIEAFGNAFKQRYGATAEWT
jgi:hypothetical protein